MTRKPLARGEYDEARAKVTPTKAQLRRMYFDRQMSYGRIAKELGCSRQYVAKLMRKHGLRGRKLSVARRVALKQGRVPGVVVERKYVDAESV